MKELVELIESGKGLGLGLALLLVLYAIRWIDNDRTKILNELSEAERRERNLLREIAELRSESERPTPAETPSARLKRAKLKSSHDE